MLKKKKTKTKNKQTKKKSVGGLWEKDLRKVILPYVAKAG